MNNNVIITILTSVSHFKQNFNTPITKTNDIFCYCFNLQATKNTNSLSYDKVRLVDENASLLVETNQLRKNLQAEINQNRKLNSLVGFTYMTPRMAQQKVNLAAASNKEIHDQYKDQIEVSICTIHL